MNVLSRPFFSAFDTCFVKGVRNLGDFAHTNDWVGPNFKHVFGQYLIFGHRTHDDQFWHLKKGVPSVSYANVVKRSNFFKFWKTRVFSTQTTWTKVSSDVGVSNCEGQKFSLSINISAYVAHIKVWFIFNFISLEIVLFCLWHTYTHTRKFIRQFP